MFATTATRSLDFVFRIAVVMLTLYVLIICPRDIKLEVRICQYLSVYRRRCLLPPSSFILRVYEKLYRDLLGITYDGGSAVKCHMVCLVTAMRTRRRGSLC